MSRIAYIFFGQVKNFDEKQYEAFQENVGDKLNGHDVDYFLTTSRSKEYTSPRQQEAEGQQIPIDPESIQKYFDFKDVFYDDQARESEDISGLAQKLVTFGDAWDSHSLTSTKNSLKQLYGLEYFWHNFKSISSDYDFFILSRCDLFHTHAFDVDCLNVDADLLTPYYDPFPQIDYGQFGGLNDRFAVAKNILSLAVYCSRYSSLKNHPQYYHAEKYLKQHVEHNKLKADKMHNFLFLMNRANNQLSDFVGINNDEDMNTNLNGVDKVYFINLDRRLDRLHHIYKNTGFFAQRVSAIDAKKIELSDEVKKLFPKTWQSRSKAEICCALSHYRLWEKLVQDKNAANYLILEDDAVFKDGFVNFWNQVFSKQMPSDYSIIYFGGCQPWNKPQYPKVLERYNDYFCRIKRNVFFTKDDHFWHMNASSYVLSKTAASLLCQWVEQNGMDDALDNFMQRFFNKNKLFAAPKSIYHLNPLMAYQLHEENDNTEIDKNSDLRYAEERFEWNQNKNSSNSRSLTELLIPLKTNLTKKRIGGAGDGGYVLLREIFNDCDTVYSYGIDDSENSDSFDVECANYNKTVFMFDGTIQQEQSKNPRLIFRRENLTADNLRSHLSINNNINKNNMILKMDIEGHEYPVIEKNIKLINDCFSMMCIEFHGLNNPNYYNYENKNYVLELILEYYDIFHMHANNWVARKFDVPNVMEISFIRKGICLNELDCAYPIKGLDFANCEDRDDYILDWWVKEDISFPALQKISNKQIPKKIHLSWKNKNVLNSNYSLIKKGAKNLELLNPDWDIEVNDDEDVNRYIRDNIGKSSWELIKDRKITEKTDLWRLLKIYKEGGLYVDIDRYIDTPLSEIIKAKTSCVIPTFQDIDFSQDFVLSCANSPMIERAISNNLFNRKNGQNLFYTAVCSYMHAVSEFLSGQKVERGNNPVYFNDIRKQIEACEYLETFREIGPEYHTLYRNITGDFNMQTFEKDKADFYNGESVIHWNIETKAKHTQLKNTNKQKLVFLQHNLFEEDFILELFDDLEVIYDLEMNGVHENAYVVYSDIYHRDSNVYKNEAFRKTLNQQKQKLSNFLNQQKNCCLVHLSDEHRHAEIDHYKNFKHVFRQYYRADAVADNVTFIPLGYKKGFFDE